MTPEEALKFIDRCADGGLGAPDYAEAYGIVDAALARAAEMDAVLTRIRTENLSRFDCTLLAAQAQGLLK